MRKFFILEPWGRDFRGKKKRDGDAVAGNYEW